MAAIVNATNPVVVEFSPPGNISDLTAQQKTQWSQFISSMFDSGVQGLTETVYQGTTYYILNNAPRPQFFNPSTTAKAPDLTERSISWIGFPKQVKDTTSTDIARWQTADASRDVQDEYCEWSVTRDQTGKITRVTFTAEGPEYWEFLGQVNPNKVVELYKQYISPDIQKSDLFDNAGKYIARNRWNTDTTNGAMHLVQKNNTLFAEVQLAAGSSMVREKNNVMLTGQQELIDCGKYGASGRNSDPLIGSEVNTLVRAGAQVALKDPVGLYIDSFNPQGWQTPDNSDPSDYWKILRGSSQAALRAVYEVPPEKGFTVGDIMINGKPIAFGAQIADFVQIKLTGIAQNIGTTPIQRFDCVSYQTTPPSAPALGVAALASDALTHAGISELPSRDFSVRTTRYVPPSSER